MLASPSDVASERDTLPVIVDEINRTPNIDYRLELLGWKTHTYPTLRGDPQAAVNYQIGDDYNVLIGILWSRFGSPTPRYDSGTQEEFERAYQRHLDQPNSVHIALYFKRRDVPIDTDPVQLQAVNQFRDRTRNEIGAYCWDFESTEEFSQHVRIHLRRIVAEVCEKNTAPRSMERAAPVEHFDDEDIGYIDLIELFNESMANINSTTNTIRESIESYGDKTVTATRQLDSMKGPSGGIDDLPAAKRVINKLAESLVAFAGTAEAGAKQMQTNTSLAVKYIEGALQLAGDFGPMEQENRIELAHSVAEMIAAAEDARSSLASLKDTLEKTPRVTVQFTKAKRKAISALEELDTILGAGNRVWDEVAAFLRRGNN